MKRAFFSIALSAFALTTMAQHLEAPIPIDSLIAEESLTNRVERDTVWQEAVADKYVNLSVFGRHARNEPYYRQLVDRFEQADTTLFGSDFLVLYYGYAYRDEYVCRSVGSPWSDLVTNKQYAEAYEMICELLKHNPASLYLLDYALGAGCAADRPTEELDRIYWRLLMIMKHISILSDGSKESPIAVVSSRDENPLLQLWLKVKPIKTQYRGNKKRPCHCVTIESEKKGSKVWFDITLPWLVCMSPNYWVKLITEQANEKN